MTAIYALHILSSFTGRIGFNTVNPSLSTYREGFLDELPREGLMVNRMAVLQQNLGIGDGFSNISLVLMEHRYNQQMQNLEKLPLGNFKEFHPHAWGKILLDSENGKIGCI